MVPRLLPARAPQALSCGLAFRSFQVLPGEVVTCFQLVKPRGEPLGANYQPLSCPGGILYFLAEARPPVQRRAQYDDPKTMILAAASLLPMSFFLFFPLLYENGLLLFFDVFDGPIASPTKGGRKR